MSPPGRAKGEYCQAQHEGAPASPARPPRRRSIPLGGTARMAKGAPSGAGMVAQALGA